MAGIDSNTILCLHMDGVNNSTTFTDSSQSPHTFTAYSGAKISTAQSVFGGASGLFNGSTDYIDTPTSTDFDIWQGNATVDFRVNFVSTAGDQGICGKLPCGINHWIIYKSSSNHKWHLDVVT